MARTEKYVIPKLDPPETFYWGPEVDRATARDLGLVRYFTGKPCRKGHVAERWVSSMTCIECTLRRHRTRDYLDANRPTAQAWVADNPDMIDGYQATRRERYATDPEARAKVQEANRRAWAARKNDPEWRDRERQRLRQYRK